MSYRISAASLYDLVEALMELFNIIDRILLHNASWERIKIKNLNNGFH
jgi:hypothetical protein